jgi:hypothetical protein
MRRSTRWDIAHTVFALIVLATVIVWLVNG